MGISPLLLLWMLMAAFAFGIGMGILNDVHRLIRVLLGVRYSKRALEKLYEVPLPILRRPLRQAKDGKGRKLLLTVVLFVQDIFLFAVAGVGISIIHYYFNNGRFRFYTVVALLLGFVLYYFTVGKLTMLFSEGIVFFLRAAISIFFAILWRPIRVFVVFFGKNAKKICKNLQNSIAKKRKWVYNERRTKQIIQQAEQGFLDRNV